jgi:hypothetical protein
MFLIFLYVLLTASFGFLLYTLKRQQAKINMLEKIALSINQVLQDLAISCKFNSEAGRSLTGVVDAIRKDNTEFQKEMAQFVVEVAKFIESNIETGESGSGKKNPLN